MNRILKQGGLHENKFLRIRASAGFVGRLRRGTIDSDNDDNYARSHHGGPGHAACHARGRCGAGSAGCPGRSTDNFARAAVYLDTRLLALDRSRL